MPTRTSSTSTPPRFAQAAFCCCCYAVVIYKVGYALPGIFLGGSGPSLGLSSSSTKRDLELNEQKNEKRIEEKEYMIKVEQRPVGKRGTKSGTKVGKNRTWKRRTRAFWPKKPKTQEVWSCFGVLELNLTLWRAWAMLLQTISFCIWLKTARLVVVAFWGRSTVLAWGISGQLVYVKTRMLVLWASWSVLASLLSSLMPGGLIVEFFGSFDFDLSPNFQTVGPRRFVKGSGLRVLAKDGKTF